MAASESGIANTAERTNDSLRRTYSAGLCIGGHPTGGIPLSVENTGENGADNSQLMHNVSIARTNSSGASLRRLFSMSNSSQPQFEENLENEIVSQAGDVGDKIFSRRGSESESVRFAMEQGIVFPIPEDLLVSYGFWSRDNFNVNTISPASPLVSDIVTPPSTNALLHKKEEEKKKLPTFVEYCSYLIHLAVFGIFGVLTRYLLQKLFASNVHVTSDGSILYLDLPSNMVGSFLMGWFGVVFKADIVHISDHLAVGLSTGYLGSLTTFSGWNQKMLELSVNGHWVFAVLGFVIGLFLAAYSIIFGIETANGLKWILGTMGKRSSLRNFRVNSLKSHVIVLSMLILVWGGLWTTSGILEKQEFKNGGSEAQLWLGCLVGPLGVWLRWWLARLNGRGLGQAGRWKWIPFGTLAANVSATCVMAGLATLKKAVKTKNCDTIASGIQFGLMGCLSTVSTFMAEFNAMRMSPHPWKAYAYAFITIVISFLSGTLIYSVPVWTLGYN
ncbi:fluoride export protein 1 [Amaranthus tricolor]|uniref:fluoride export protein 1 n=1 Tax=Amaranthus tricolor TaxID=29722 RepID=UPI0025891184|nr:fluoride export protein 1 [Amaranthus tricolor]XP_057533826.1 fluoride export protein 1 [Amaranthus tricolor]